jgi:hypothetical protein
MTLVDWQSMESLSEWLEPFVHAEIRKQIEACIGTGLR